MSEEDTCRICAEWRQRMRRETLCRPLPLEKEDSNSSTPVNPAQRASQLRFWRHVIEISLQRSCRGKDMKSIHLDFAPEDGAAVAPNSACSYFGGASLSQIAQKAGESAGKPVQCLGEVEAILEKEGSIVSLDKLLKDAASQETRTQPDSGSEMIMSLIGSFASWTISSVASSILGESHTRSKLPSQTTYISQSAAERLASQVLGTFEGQSYRLGHLAKLAKSSLNLSRSELALAVLWLKSKGQAATEPASRHFQGLDADDTLIKVSTASPVVISDAEKAATRLATTMLRLEEAASKVKAQLAKLTTEIRTHLASSPTKARAMSPAVVTLLRRRKAAQLRLHQIQDQLFNLEQVDTAVQQASLQTDILAAYKSAHQFLDKHSVDQSQVEDAIEALDEVLEETTVPSASDAHGVEPDDALLEEFEKEMGDDEAETSQLPRVPTHQLSTKPQGNASSAVTKDAHHTSPKMLAP